MGPSNSQGAQGPSQAYAGDQRAGLIASVRDAGHQSSSPEGPAAPPRHLGVGPAFIHKDQLVHRLRSQLFMPSSSFFGHVRPVLFGGDQSFFYTSSPAAEAINRSWKFGRAGPCEHPTRPAWRRVDRTAVVAAAVCVPWSAACDVRSNASAARSVPRCRNCWRTRRTAATQKPKNWAISRVLLPVHRAEECAGASEQVWLS